MSEHVCKATDYLLEVATLLNKECREREGVLPVPTWDGIIERMQHIGLQLESISNRYRELTEAIIKWKATLPRK